MKMDIRTMPFTDNLEFPNKMVVDMLPIYFAETIDASIENIKNEYQNTKNDFFLPAICRMEQCLFRLYEAKYFVLPHKRDINIYGYAFDDAYHAEVNKEVEKFFDKDYAQSEYDAAIEFVHEKNYEEAGKHFGNAAFNGHVAAQYNYGVSVANGEIGEKDTTEGAFWYFMAAKGGYEKAMINLAIAYRNGTGLYPNGYMMMYWYATAALIPFPYGVYNLGLTLINDEVFVGYAAIGRQLKLCSERLDDITFREYACDTASLILERLEKYVFNV